MRIGLRVPAIGAADAKGTFAESTSVSARHLLWSEPVSMQTGAEARDKASVMLAAASARSCAISSAEGCGITCSRPTRFAPLDEPLASPGPETDKGETGGVWMALGGDAGGVDGLGGAEAELGGTDEGIGSGVTAVTGTVGSVRDGKVVDVGRVGGVGTGTVALPSGVAPVLVDWLGSGTDVGTIGMARFGGRLAGGRATLEASRAGADGRGVSS